MTAVWLRFVCWSTRKNSPRCLFVSTTFISARREPVCQNAEQESQPPYGDERAHPGLVVFEAHRLRNDGRTGDEHDVDAEQERDAAGDDVRGGGGVHAVAELEDRPA